MAAHAVFLIHRSSQLLLITQSDLLQVEGRSSATRFRGFSHNLIQAGGRAELRQCGHLAACVCESLWQGELDSLPVERNQRAGDWVAVSAIHLNHNRLRSL